MNLGASKFGQDDGHADALELGRARKCRPRRNGHYERARRDGHEDRRGDAVDTAHRRAFRVAWPKFRQLADPREKLGWAPNVPLSGGLTKTCAWIERQVKRRQLSVIERHPVKVPPAHGNERAATVAV
jgi:hypothetical protein